MLIETTWNNLYNLRNNSQLIPGHSYRITNYATTTSQSDTQSAGHAFDVIVIADAVNKLNENARAIQHSGDTYFNGQILESWEIKYCIDNDTDRFAWASTSGKGVIYYMKDEYGNECGYDFKNIQMKYYKITATTTTATGLVNTYSASRSVGNSSGSLAPSNCTINSSDYEWRYTFDLFKDGTHKDYSLNNYNTSSSYAKYCYDNKINDSYDRLVSSSTTTRKQRFINFISFRNTTMSSECYGNTFGIKNYNFSFGKECYYNTFGNYCYFNTFGDICRYNTFGDDCMHNVFDNSCMRNVFGTECDYNIFGSSCYSNIFGNESKYNTFGFYCKYNTFGFYCYSNILDRNCNYNTFGTYCENNYIENECNYNHFGICCSYNSIGKYYNLLDIESGTSALTKRDGIGSMVIDDYGYGDFLYVGEEPNITITGVTGVYLHLVYEDSDSGEDFSGNVKILLYNIETGERVALFDGNVTISDEDDYSDLSGNFVHPSGSNVKIIYEVRGFGSQENVFARETEGY